MEAIKEEAEQCIRIAVQALREREFEKAEKVLVKVEETFPNSPGLKEGIERLKKLARNPDGTNQAAQQEANGDYTADQLEVVQKVQNSKNYYEMLGVAKEATDTEIKNSYKKLAFLLHPDNNFTPGAEEAFRAVGNAAAILTDPEKRKEYDENGSDGLENEFSTSEKIDDWEKILLVGIGVGIGSVIIAAMLKSYCKSDPVETAASKKDNATQNSQAN